MPYTRTPFAARAILAVIFAAGLLLIAARPAAADTVPPFKGNDTGGIIAWTLVESLGSREVHALAINHCAQYGKVAKLRSIHPWYGDYVSFGCVWEKPVAATPTISVAY